MRIAITANDQNLDTDVDQRFGRTPYFLLVDTDNLGFEVIENKQSFDLPQGAGIQAAQNIVPYRPVAVLTGNCGPKAFKVLEAAKIEVVTGVKGKIRDVVKAYVDGAYHGAEGANVEEHWV